MSLEGKRALITGSTSGIGLATARALRGAGADIVLNGFGDMDAIKALQEELQADYVAADLTSEAGCEELMDGAGAVDILVNNAGMQFVSPVEDFPSDKWETIIALNLSSAFYTSRRAIPHMKAEGWGRIICTASAHSLTASPYKAAYVAAKHGIAGLVKTMALELATSGVTANAISPGYVWTPLVENQIPDTMKARGMTRDQVINDVLLAGQPTKRFTQPDEVGALALFLCSEAAQNVTGANYTMDGGWTA